MKAFLTLTIITFFVSCQTLLSQSVYDTVINFLSLENKEVSVKYGYDPNKDRLIFELNPSEKLCIQDARGAEAKILQKKFVELRLSMPGGSGEAVYNLAIICVSKGKLYKSIHVVSSVKDLIGGCNSFEVNFTELMEKDRSFELIANGKTKLKFDFDNKIFYNAFETLNGLYYVNSDKDPINQQLKFQNERFPAVHIDPGETYIFINHKWFAKIAGNYNLHLMEFSSDCN
jgi:hypothetical protein